MLAEAIRQLPADLRQACLLRDVMHYSSQEVADRLQISVVAVRLRVFRARRRLQEKLEVALRPPKPRVPRSSGAPWERHAMHSRPGFVPLRTMTSFASGD
jgi:hypothetical protein